MTPEFEVRETLCSGALNELAFLLAASMRTVGVKTRQLKSTNEAIPCLPSLPS